MNLDQLRYLVDLAETKSMNTTAKNMYISQPSISESIRRLEKELNCVLVERTRTGVVFTEDGILVLETARKMVRQQDELLDSLRLRSEEHSVKADLTICLGYSAEDMFFPKFTNEMACSYPNIRLQLMEMTFSEFSEQCKNGTFQIGLYEFPENSIESFPETIQQNYDILPLYREPLVYIMAANHPLARKPYVTEEDLQQYPAAFFTHSSKMPSNTVLASSNLERHCNYLLQKQAVSALPVLIYQKFFSTKEYTAKFRQNQPWYRRCLLLPKEASTTQPVGYSQLVKTAIKYGLEINSTIASACNI